ncbi:MAG TPA: multifunctional CCA tRNA nucleotidyl transferase/2'3'-cyclic phosphodiesterase/2'nucleotidase/phosphatase, partial [Candidatus Pseudomonas excrementavium]|nr:multifunctional CCA tRNA nucleotidyl transferase/2'3'-cyclic phosphodiesterase/2'nucleotidase/phosphatase [Candidatus Pseudomonas excrementavium]
LLHDLGKGRTPERFWPKHHGHENKGLAAVKAVNQRCKAPRDCQELALLTCEFHTHCHRALELKPGTLLKLFKAFDIYRRPERFEQFLGACEADARGRTGLEQREYPQPDYLRGAAEAARSADVQTLLEQGLKGAELGAALERERLRLIAEYKELKAAP